MTRLPGRRIGCPRLAAVAATALLASGWGAAIGVAAPHVPAADSIVLERIPGAAEARALEPLRARLARRPGDLSGALELARRYLEIGRENADPRYVSYAEATLAPWLAAARPDPNALTVAAIALQYLHRFDAALVLLDRALARDPSSGQAWLTRASLLQLEGRFAEARAACRKLIERSGQLIAITCLTAVNSLTGELASSYAALRGVYDDDPRLAPAVRVWVLDQLGDMAERAGDYRSCERYLEAARRIAPRDPYSAAAYADLLLLEHRDADVLRLLGGASAQDNLLLRLAIASAHLGTAESAWAQAYQARYEAARRDGDETHLREAARFLLEVRHDSSAALALAARNWRIQREPADVRILAAAALAAHDAAAASRVRAWIAQTHYEDRSLAILGAAHTPP